MQQVRSSKGTQKVIPAVNLLKKNLHCNAGQRKTIYESLSLLSTAVCCVVRLYIYHPQTEFMKAMFSQVFVCPFIWSLSKGGFCPQGLCQGDPPVW